MEENSTSTLNMSIHSVPQLQDPSTSSQQETQNSGQLAGLLQARVASNAMLTQQTLDDHSTSSEDHDFEALSTFEEFCVEGGTMSSDSDQTVVSNFDDLEGVSEGELSFSDQSQPPSPPLLSTTCMPGSTHNETAQNNNIFVGETANSTTDATPIEPMDTECTATHDETNCFSNKDNCSMSTPQDMDSTTDQATSWSICTQSGDHLAAGLAVASPEHTQQIPGMWEQAKDDDGDDELSHLSDKEWGELSFESPVFIQATNRGSDSTKPAYATPFSNTSTATQHKILSPDTEYSTEACHSEENELTQATRTEACHSELPKLTTDIRTNSAFGCLENYEDTVSEDDTICVHPVVPQLRQNHGNLCGPTLTCAAVMGLATHSEELLTCDVTDDDFCWEIEQDK